MHRLQADRVRLFSSVYAVARDGAAITMLKLARLRPRAQFDVDGEQYTVRREGVLGRTVLLERAGTAVLRAERRGFLPIQYEIRADRSLTLRGRWPTRAYVLTHGEREIATIRPKQRWSRSAVAELREELPLATEIFLIALVLLRWRARARSAS